MFCAGHRRNDVLAFIRAGLTDFSVSRARERRAAGGFLYRTTRAR
jgi:hypothetical protein